MCRKDICDWAMVGEFKGRRMMICYLEEDEENMHVCKEPTKKEQMSCEFWAKRGREKLGGILERLWPSENVETEDVPVPEESSGTLIPLGRGLDVAVEVLDKHGTMLILELIEITCERENSDADFTLEEFIEACCEDPRINISAGHIVSLIERNTGNWSGPEAMECPGR